MHMQSCDLVLIQTTKQFLDLSHCKQIMKTELYPLIMKPMFWRLIKNVNMFKTMRIDKGKCG